MEDDPLWKQRFKQWNSTLTAAFGTPIYKNLIESSVGKLVLTSWFGRTVSKIYNLPDRALARLSGLEDRLKVSKTPGDKMKLRGIKGVIGALQVFGALGDLLDILQIVSVFTDAAFYCRPEQGPGECALPAESYFLNPQTLSGIKRNSIKQQILGLVSANRIVDNMNQDTQDDSFPRVHDKFPFIVGPFDILDAVRGDNDPYWINTRVQVEINSIIESRIKNTLTYRQLFIDSGYGDILSSASESVLDYITGEESVFTAAQYSEVYEDAFRTVCSYNGGITYKDEYPSNQLVNGQPWKPLYPRLQCGWPDSTSCHIRAAAWVADYENNGFTAGNYGEWFSFDDPDLIDSSGNKLIPNKPAGSTSPSVRDWGRSGACMATSSGLNSMCSFYKGTYNYTSHTCEFTSKYCQSLGACFDESTKACFLPADDMAAAAFFFGTGGPREFIRVFGCKTPARGVGILLMPFGGIVTEEGRQFWQDALKNNKNWGPGFKASFENPTIAIETTAAVLGISASIFPALGPAAIVVGIAAGIAAGVEAANSKVSRQLSTTGDPREFSIGGVKQTSDGSWLPVAATLGDGWITKPLQIFPNGTKLTAQNIPGMYSDDFFPCLNPASHSRSDVDGALRFAVSKPCSYGRYDYQKLCWKDVGSPNTYIRLGSDSGANRLWCIPLKPDAASFTDSNIGGLITEEPSLFNRIWTDGSDPGFPVAPTEGMQYGIDRSNMWFYQLSYDRNKMKMPTGLVTSMPGDQANQLSTSKNITMSNFSDFSVGHVLDDTSSSALGISGSVTITAIGNGTMTISYIEQTVSAKTNITIKSITPSALWNDMLLTKYFNYSTITDMRQYYCKKWFYANVTGASIDKRCFGYLRIRTDKYVMRPMTMLSQRATAISGTVSKLTGL